MKIIKTHEVSPATMTNAMHRDWGYNGLDCCVTLEIFDIINDQHDNYTPRTYQFSRELQGPCLEMRLRGIKVDTIRRGEVIDYYFNRLDFLETNLERLVLDSFGFDKFNWRSTADLKRLFYGALQIPEMKSKGKVSVDVNVMEKLEQYTIARLFVKHIKLMRELGKKISVLKTVVDPDGRIRTSYNIAGTSTGRFSSSASEFGTGGNLQNIEEALRSIFIADKGYKFAKFDAKSGESFLVGAIEWNLFGDDKYLSACETGDPHTAVARICWPNLGWTGNLKSDKEKAETPYYRHYTYRFMCKKLGHGSNYGGQPYTLATQSHLPISVVQQFQPVYFSAFPAHLEWQSWVKEQIHQYGSLVTLTGRKRRFMGRRNDADTIRGAIAYDPQGSLADIVNQGMLNVWRTRSAYLVMQDHDAITVAYPQERENEIVPLIIKQLEVPIKLAKGRQLLIPYDCEVGWNRAHYHETKNPDGLKAYDGNDKRKRQPEVGILDRRIHRAYG